MVRRVLNLVRLLHCFDIARSLLLYLFYFLFLYFFEISFLFLKVQHNLLAIRIISYGFNSFLVTVCHTHAIFYFYFVQLGEAQNSGYLYRTCVLNSAQCFSRLSNTKMLFAYTLFVLSYVSSMLFILLLNHIV